MFIITFFRLFLAVVFLYSGFVKAVDPWGTAIKIQEYLHAFGAESWVAAWAPMAGSLLLSAVEFLIGASLLANSWRRLCRTGVLLFMCVMTPVTLWLAIDNPVSDCGCFGDAVVLTNWQTFWKNVVLLVCAIILYIYNKCVVPRPLWLSIVVPLLSLITVGGVQYYALRHLPLIDFRPYKVGADIRAGMMVPEDAPRPEYATDLVFERNGEHRVFSLDEYPDSTWTYIRTEVRLVKEGYQPPVHDFAIMSAYTHEDVTGKVLAASHVYLVIAYDLKKADTRSASLINSLYERCQSEGVPFYFITASTEPAFREWAATTGARYTFYQMDGTTQKTIIRANPGVVELQTGRVIGKWNANDLCQ